MYSEATVRNWYNAFADTDLIGLIGLDSSKPNPKEEALKEIQEGAESLFNFKKTLEERFKNNREISLTGTHQLDKMAKMAPSTLEKQGALNPEQDATSRKRKRTPKTITSPRKSNRRKF